MHDKKEDFERETMTCQEEILSNEYIDYIWKVNLQTIPAAELQGACYQYISQNYSVFYVNPLDIFNNPPLIGDYGTPFCLTQMDTESLEASRILTIQNQPALNLKGKDVIIGFLDSGIALENPVFQRRDGGTRILGLWDQTDQSGTPPEGFAFGSAYSREQIDALLGSGEELPGADGNGHGTRVAAIAAGSELSDENFIGAAPEADIAFVKLKQAKPLIRSLDQIPQDSIAYQESDIMLGIRYLDMLADRYHKPLIICLALGSNAGGHTGSTPLGLYLGEFTRRAGRAVTVAAGNEGNKGHHFYGEIPMNSNYLDVELRVGEEDRGFQMNLWGNSPGLLSVEISSPSGERVPVVFSRLIEMERYEFLFENTVLDIQYELMELSSGDERLLLSFRDPTPGIWNIRVYAIGSLENSFHIWLPVSGFISDGTYFLRPDPDTTVTEPANAYGVTAFGGYDVSSGAIWLDSGRGYARNGIVKPDLTAPAVGVSTIDARGNASTLTGTSAAVALGAGASALLFEWGIVRGNAPTMDSVAVQRYLIRGAARSAGSTYPSQVWGYGKLDLYGSFLAIRGGRIL